MWLSSVNVHPPSLSPDNYGWIYNVTGQYEVSWFDCDMSPPSLHLIIKEDEEQYIGTDDKGIIILLLGGILQKAATEQIYDYNFILD